MKIIKQGKLPEKIEHQVKCRECSTIFSFLQKEATLVSDQRDGDYLSIQCPTCKKVATVTPRGNR